jgi:hypothetical protein
MPHHIAGFIGAAASILQVAMPAARLAAVQGFGPRSRTASEYEVTVIHDRVVDSTRVTGFFTGSSRTFGLDSRAWLGLAFSYLGDRLTARPAFVTLTIAAWTPARGGWAFAHPEPLQVRSGDTLGLEVAPAGYVKLPVHMLDSGRREELWFDIPSKGFDRLARAPDLVFSAGRARFRVRERMEMLRQVLGQMTPSDRGAQ